MFRTHGREQLHQLLRRAVSATTCAWSRDAPAWLWAPRRFVRALPTSSRRSASACCTSAITTSSPGCAHFAASRNSKLSCASCARAFQSADLPAVLRLLDKHFDGATYSLRSLFRDERQKVVSKILGTTMDEAEAAYRQIYEHHAPLMGFLSDMGAPLPKMLHLTAEFVLNTALRKEFLADEIDLERIQTSARHGGTREDPVGRSVAGLRAQSAPEPHGRRAGGESPRRTAATLQRGRRPGALVALRGQPGAACRTSFTSCCRTSIRLSRWKAMKSSQRWISEFAALGEKLGVCVEPAAAAVVVTSPS